jgi:hypothetical protein
MKARASNNLNDQSKSRYNVFATRKLPIWNGSSFSAPTATRNPVWAFVDNLRAVYSGNIPNSKIDLAGLLTLANNYDALGDTFDWVFDKKGTVWGNAKLIARAGRASPVVNITQFSMVRDQQRSVPVLSFSPDSMIRGSFRVDYDLQRPDDYDGIEVLYQDHDTYKEESVECLIESDAGVNTQKLRIPGITNRDKAYREGLFIRAQQIYQRQQIQFGTGLESIIPSFGTFVAVGHDAPKWGNTGVVKSIEADGLTINVSEDLTDVTGGSIAFRDKYGGESGPYSVSKTPGNGFQLKSTTTIDQSNLSFSEYTDPPAYFFGASNEIYQGVVVTNITSGGSSAESDETGTVTGVNYDDRVYQFDTQVAPALGTVSTPISAPNLPVVTGVSINVDPVLLTAATIVWDIAEGARYYVVQRSNDGINWDAVATPVANLQPITIEPGLLYVRVAGVSSAQGPWAVYSESVGLNVRVTSNGDVRVDSTGANRRVAT